MGKNFTFEEMNMTLEMVRDWNIEENWESIRSLNGFCSKIITEHDNSFLVQAVYDVMGAIENYIDDFSSVFEDKESDYETLMYYLIAMFKYNRDYDNKNEPIQIFKTAWFYTTNALFGE